MIERHSVQKSVSLGEKHSTQNSVTIEPLKVQVSPAAAAVLFEGMQKRMGTPKAPLVMKTWLASFQLCDYCFWC
jgi:hypothetical protein